MEELRREYFYMDLAVFLLTKLLKPRCRIDVYLQDSFNCECLLHEMWELKHHATYPFSVDLDHTCIGSKAREQWLTEPASRISVVRLLATNIEYCGVFKTPSAIVLTMPETALLPQYSNFISEFSASFVTRKEDIPIYLFL